MSSDEWMTWHRQQMDKEVAFGREMKDRADDFWRDQMDKRWHFHLEEMAKMFRHAWVMFFIGVAGGVGVAAIVAAQIIRTL